MAVLITRSRAARLLEVGITKFDKLVESGEIPKHAKTEKIRGRERRLFDKLAVIGVKEKIKRCKVKTPSDRIFKIKASGKSKLKNMATIDEVFHNYLESHVKAIIGIRMKHEN